MSYSNAGELAFNNVQDQIEKTISKTEIIEYGYITEIKDDKVHMKVQLATEPTIISCVLASFQTNGLQIKVEASAGDKVLVLFPKKYHKDMWNAEEMIDNPYATGYDIFSGIAMPINIFGKKESQDLIAIGSDGSLEAKIGGSTLTMTTNTLNYTNGNGTIDMASDGTVTINSHLEIKA